MKKLLLLLFLSLSFIAKAESDVPPLYVCDDNNDGFAVFNLDSVIPYVLSQLANPENYLITFHKTVTEVQSGANPIVNTSAYTNTIPNMQTIWIRMEDTTVPGGVSYVDVDLVVNSVPTAIISGSATVCQNSFSPTITITGAGGTLPLVFTYMDQSGTTQTVVTSGASRTVTIPVNSTIPGSFTYQLISVSGSGSSICSGSASGVAVITVIAQTATPASLSFCDPMELAIYNLSDANNQITSDLNAVITYHENIYDAQLGINAVGPGYVPTLTPVQTLFARVQNPTLGCYTTTTLTLNTHNCAPCQDSAPYHLFATNPTDTSLSLHWETTPGMGIQVSLISVMPFGIPPSETNAISVQTGQLPQIITGLQSENCYSIYVKGFCGSGYSNWSEPLDICMPNCANASTCAEGLVLNAFLDSNNNGIKDSGEIDFNAGSFVYRINNSGNNQYGTTNSGSYSIYDSNATNSYDINFTVNSELAAYYTSSVTHNDVTLPDGSGLQYLSFPIINTVPYADGQVSLNPFALQPRPGFNYQVAIYYRNNGLLPIDGRVTFTKHPTVTIESISQSGAVLTSGGFTYDFTNLPPLSTQLIIVTLHVAVIPIVNIGDYITNTAIIEVNNDVNSSNSSSTYSQIVVGSYDPNDITESHGGKIVHDDFTANDYLYYTIQFENTGTASAEFIRVENTLDSQLDETTFEMLDASHNVNTKRKDNSLTWHFDDINLPPTSSNPSGSHGYIHYRIKPKAGYTIGDIIPNQASIFFDYNPPIVTNRFDTQFVEALRNPSFNSNTISLYPNPTKDRVTIVNKGVEKISKISIYDIAGKRIYTLNNNALENITIDVSHFAKGLYLVELSSENNSKINKKLLIK